MKPFDYAHGGKSLCADGFHLSRVLGQYIASAVWFEFFTGKSVIGNAFVPSAPLYVGREQSSEDFQPNFAPDSLFVPTAEELEAAQRAAHAAMHP